MCDLISYVEKEGKYFFITGKDLRDKHIKKFLDGTKDVIGHGFVRKVYNIKGGTDRENRDFWNGDLPDEIKQAWNAGEFDGLLEYLDSNDMEYIVQNAPVEYVGWVLKHKYPDIETMKTDSHWAIRMAGLAATQDYEAMKTDSDRDIRMVGLAATLPD